jgi:PAS domain S-box-containing protein
VESYALIDTSKHDALDALVSMAALALGTPMAALCLVAADRVWAPALAGLALREWPLPNAPCAHIVDEGQALVLRDTTKDPRFASHALVRGEAHVRFYAGVPLRSPEGHVLGCCSVMDSAPREWSDGEQEMLELIARQASALLEARRSTVLSAAQAREAATLRGFFAQSLDLMCTVNDAMHFELLNPRWTQVLGFSLEEIRAIPFPDFIHPDDLAPTMEVAGQLYTDPDCVLVNFENRYKHKDGHWVRLAWVATVLEGVIFASGRVMTAFYEREAKLDATLATVSETDSRMRSILASANYIIIETTPDGTIREFNAAAERQLGYSADEVVDKTSPAIFHDLDEVVARAAELTEELAVEVEPGFEAFVAKARRGVPDEREWTYIRKDGSSFTTDLTITARWNDAGEIVGFVGMGGDRTEQKRARERLRTSETRLRSIIDTAVDAIITIDEQGIIGHVNPAVQKLFGYEPGRLLGQNVRVLMPRRYAEEHDGYLANYRTTGVRKIIGIGREVVGQRQDGSTFPAELAVSEYLLDGERFFTGVIRDVSERKRVERLQSEFVSTVSHELRTPLTSIRGSLGLVAGGVLGELPPDAKEYVDIAVSNSDRLVRLINDILDIEKMESGTMEFRMESVNIRASVEGAIADNAAYAQSHDARLVCGTIPEGEVLADPDRLAQVLANLISNAAKFSPPNGAVELSVERLGHYVRVNVRDHGPGISKEFESRIFQRFAQADGSVTRKVGGTGLGLSITKSIVENMDGRIGFSAAEGGGTNFFFELPFLHPVKSVVPEPDLRRVLVCEDNRDVRMVIEEALRTVGYAVHSAPTLERARRLLSEYTYDAITLDLILADGEAFDLIHELRAAKATQQTPIIVVSGSDRTLGPAAVLVNDVIPKPFAHERLLDAISRAVRRAPDEMRVLHVEDDADIRRIVRRTLPQEWKVTSAGTLELARKILASDTFDVVILDLSLPDGFGDELLCEVGSAEVIIFSANDASAELSRRVSSALVKSRATPIDVRDTILALLEHAQGSVPLDAAVD